jgi:CRISPR-associated endonuclease Cas1
MAALSEARRRELRREYQAGPLPLRRRGRVLVAEGFATSVSVGRGRLRVRSGSGRAIREESFGRATHGLARIVIVGRGGVVSLAALGWCTDAGIGVLVLDRDARPLAISGRPGLDDARLRRAQALAAGSELGLEIGKLLIARKLEGQRQVVGKLPDLGRALAARAAITAALTDVERAETLEQLRLAESQAARSYWLAWRRVPLSFARKDAHRVPDSWRFFGSRTSPLSGGPRLATTPGNALANLLYALAEQEASLALRGVGLDAGLGVLHRDQPARASMSLDLLEGIRPAIDCFLLSMLRERTFAASDFYETRRGSVRVLAPLSHQLAETLPAWAELLAPLAEQLAETLLAGRPTPLTQTRRSAGRDRVRRRAPGPPAHATPNVPRSCPACGTSLPRSDLVFCDDCRPEQLREQGTALSATGRTRLAKLRAQGIDPSATPEAKAKIGRANTRANQEARAWERENARPDPDIFAREILPLIADVPLRRLAAATGLSIQYCGLIRRGLRTPHPRHWDALAHAGSS